MKHDFNTLVSKADKEWNRLESGRKTVIRVGVATCGKSAGASETLEALKKAAGNARIACHIVEVGCAGLCYAEPVVSVTNPSGPMVVYGKIDAAKADELIERHVIQQSPMVDHILGTQGERRLDGIPRLEETPVFKPQIRRILKKCGLIDPSNVYHYLANHGYSGLNRAMGMSCREIIKEIKASGLRGRGGAGFSTGTKWQFCYDAPGEKKYLICNADEGDPGAFMNRSLIEGDPHAVIEGMIIAGKAIGAMKGYIYCRSEYPLALKRLETALEQARELGFLGDRIMGSDFCYDIQIKKGAGAFVCGEETALIASIEGARGMPRPRPPFPAVSGLWGCPTIINNVETLASVSLILQKSAAWFAGSGSPDSKGTKTFALVGEINRPGLVEVPLGITLREIIYDIGGGILNDKEFKAVQTGGPSGGCIPASLLDTPVDYDSLKAAGSIMGSGGMVVMNADSCMVDVAKYFLEFTQKESCGGCVPCRLGTRQMLDILENITKGKGEIEDFHVLQELCLTIKKSALCGLGQTAPNPVISTLKHFNGEYKAHILEKKCPAKVCRALISFVIDPEKCTGCGSCRKSCSVEAISGAKKKIHVIDQQTCIRCGICIEKCPEKFDAIRCISGKIQ